MQYVKHSNLLQPIWRPRVIDSHPLARDLVFAGVPTPQGYWDASPYANHALQRVGTAPFVNDDKTGKAYAFSTSSRFTTLNDHTPALGSAGFSMAMWVNFTTGTPTSYGAVFGRNGTEGATHAGGDWSVTHRDTGRNLVLTRSGAELAATNNPVSGGLWYLWHLSVASGGSFTWWLSGPGAEDTIARGSGTGTPTRTGAGVLHVNSSLTGSGQGNSQIGRVYLWNRETTIEDARRLYRDEWSLYERPRERRIWVPVSAGGSASEGAVSKALGDVTLSSAGQLLIQGQAAQTLAALTLSATGQAGASAALSATLVDLISFATGKLEIKAQAAPTLVALTSSAAGQLLIKGAASQTLAALTLTAEGAAGTLTTGSLAATLADATLSAAAKLQIQAALAQTLGTLSSTSTGALRIAGQTSQTLGALTLSSAGTGASPIAGTLGITLGDLVLVAAGGEVVTVPREVRRFASPICQAVNANSYITTAVTLTSTIDIEAT